MQRDYESDGKLSCILDQFMIADKYQGNGFGKAAMKLWISEIEKTKNYDSIILCYIDGDIGWYKFFNDKNVKNRYNIANKEKENEVDTEENALSVSEGLILDDVVEGEIGYIYLPQMFGGEQVEVDMEEIKKYLFTVKNYQGLIIDVRGNSGGSDMYITKSGVCNEEFKTTPHYEIEGYTKVSDFKYDSCIKKVLYLENLN